MARRGQRLIGEASRLCQSFQRVFANAKQDNRAVDQRNSRSPRQTLIRQVASSIGYASGRYAQKEAKGKKAQVEYKVQVLLDLKAPDDLGFTIYHPRIQRIVLEQLIAEDGIDSVLKEPFPVWSRPPLISMPIAPFSKFSDARCNFRYGKADEQGFVVTTSTAQQLVAALKTVTSDEFLGKTWHPLHTGMIEQKKNRKVKACDILIAYPSWDIQTLSTVDIIASPKLNTTPKEKIRAAKRFGEMAEPLLTSMKQRQTSSSIPDYLTILLIRQISNGQIQLAYSAQSTLSDFSLSASKHGTSRRAICRRSSAFLYRWVNREMSTVFSNRDCFFQKTFPICCRGNGYATGLNARSFTVQRSVSYLIFSCVDRACGDSALKTCLK